jgi:hypothetical protein
MTDQVEIDYTQPNNIYVYSTTLRAGRCKAHANLNLFPKPVPCQDCAKIIVRIEDNGLVNCYHRTDLGRALCPRCDGGNVAKRLVRGFRAVSLNPE